MERFLQKLRSIGAAPPESQSSALLFQPSRAAVSLARPPLFREPDLGALLLDWSVVVNDICKRPPTARFSSAAEAREMLQDALSEFVRARSMQDDATDPPALSALLGPLPALVELLKILWSIAARSSLFRSAEEIAGLEQLRSMYVFYALALQLVAAPLHAAWSRLSPALPPRPAAPAEMEQPQQHRPPDDESLLTAREIHRNRAAVASFLATFDFTERIRERVAAQLKPGDAQGGGAPSDMTMKHLWEVLPAAVVPSVHRDISAYIASQSQASASGQAALDAEQRLFLEAWLWRFGGLGSSQARRDFDSYGRTLQSFVRYPLRSLQVIESNLIRELLPAFLRQAHPQVFRSLPRTLRQAANSTTLHPTAALLDVVQRPADLVRAVMLASLDKQTLEALVCVYTRVVR